MTKKGYTPSWMFYRTLKNTVMFDASKLSSSLLTDGGNGVYTFNKANTASAALTYDGVEHIDNSNVVFINHTNEDLIAGCSGASGLSGSSSSSGLLCPRGIAAGTEKL
ncbi:MAG: hypothetical protein ACI3Y5_02205 [Prevotella sp.]